MRQDHPRRDLHQRRNGETPGAWPGAARSRTATIRTPWPLCGTMAQSLRYCYPWKAWLVWTGTHWQRDTSGHVMRLAKQTVKRLARQAEDLDDEKKIAALLAHIKASLSTAKLKALVECAQSEEGIPVHPEALDTRPLAPQLYQWHARLTHRGRCGTISRRTCSPSASPSPMSPRPPARRGTRFSGALWAGARAIARR